MDVSPKYEDIPPPKEENTTKPKAAIPFKEEWHPSQDPFPAKPTSVSEQKVYDQAAENKRLRRQARYLALIALGAMTIIVCILTMMGSASQDYTKVQGLSNLASFLILPAAAVTGGTLAYIIAHPVRIKNPAAPKLTVNGFLVAIGYIFGLIPGLFWLLIISYPLSKHACELSGSKYC